MAYTSGTDSRVYYTAQNVQQRHTNWSNDPSKIKAGGNFCIDFFIVMGIRRWSLFPNIYSKPLSRKKCTGTCCRQLILNLNPIAANIQGPNWTLTFSAGCSVWNKDFHWVPAQISIFIQSLMILLAKKGHIQLAQTNLGCQGRLGNHSFKLIEVEWLIYASLI